MVFSLSKISILNLGKHCNSKPKQFIDFVEGYNLFIQVVLKGMCTSASDIILSLQRFSISRIFVELNNSLSLTKFPNIQNLLC